ncbi:hypothetical protein BZA05DRAFT_410176 [Tricharina praecox]|uniref:uncharacterized protein n=1 Tax=Tricharina praecox TaxID=43433 RepID=UPI00221EC2C0|nr:uncharacterized protein BZA05DRAFT_410176 [Tricharina praecox]KAI5844188.1 hypothetical protein BZA05DRAFT_410176 [Tricharina praecox]
MPQPQPLRLLLRRRPPGPYRLFRPFTSRRYTSSQSTSSIETPPPPTQLPPTHPSTRLQRTLQTLQTTGHGPSSRIELALRGLEQRDAPTRIAVIGAIATIVPSLLSLASSAAEDDLHAWIAAHDKPGRGLLIRHGAAPKLTTPTGSPLSILTVPVPFLKDVELVATAHCGSDPLVPVFQAADVPGSRVFEYPVHKAVLYAGEGADGVRRLVEFPVQRGEGEGVLRVLALPGAAKAVEEGKVMVVDPTSGQAVERVKEWLLEGTASPADGGVKPVVNALLRDILSHARLSLASELVEPPPSAQPAAESDTAETLAAAIGIWSHSAHLELKSSIETAFASKEWNKLHWYKLPYRIDDVPTIARYILKTGFLPEAEGAATFLAGRMLGAGYNKGAQIRTTTGDVVQSDGNIAPTHIPLQREAAVNELVPVLHAAGQRFLFKSLGTTAQLGALSALLVAEDVSLYSALSVAALGTVGSAMWLQKRWGSEKVKFQEAVREKARVAVVESERWAWGRLKEGLVKVVDDEVERESRRRRMVLEEEIKEGLEICKSESICRTKGP